MFNNNPFCGCNNAANQNPNIANNLMMPGDSFNNAPPQDRRRDDDWNRRRDRDWDRRWDRDWDRRWDRDRWDRWDDRRRWDDHRRDWDWDNRRGR